MLGALIGDTVGSIYEFCNTKEYDFRLFTSESGYTDDSVMTMAVAYWLLSDTEHTYQKLEDTGQDSTSGYSGREVSDRLMNGMGIRPIGRRPAVIPMVVTEMDLL